MPENTSEVKRPNDVLTVRLDRVQLVARAMEQRLPDIPGFVVRRDSFVHPQTRIRTYERVRNFKNYKTGTTIDVQYRARPPWLQPIKLTVVAEDPKGLQRPEFESICGQFSWARLLTVELALDFQYGSKVNRSFVLAHGVFGRSALVGGRLFRDLRYGTRHSETLVRAYDKPKINCFRVEIELHSKWLRKFGLGQPVHLSKLPPLLCFDRVLFVEVKWDVLTEYLERKNYDASTLEKVRAQSWSIDHTLNCLRRQVSLVNVRRFLKPLPVNSVIKHRLRAWAIRWSGRTA